MLSSSNQDIPSKYIHPFTDFGFKKIFGEEANKDLLIDFLNQLLPIKDQIKTLNYKTTEHLPNNITDRKAVFDLYCENEKGEKFIVELQRMRQRYFKDRSIYYSTFPIQEQAIKGNIERQAWDYQLKSVYVISLMDFSFDNHFDLLRHVKLMETSTKEIFYEKLTYVYLEMPKFKKNENELVTHFDKWLYLLNNLNSFLEQPKVFQEAIFRRVFKIAEYTGLMKEDKKLYHDSLKTYRDYMNTLDYLQEESFNDGFKKGNKEGLEEGKKTKAIEVAKNALKMGLSKEQVSKLSGLSIEEVATLSI
ncbi:PD-(D/E)XK nuclease family transposase [Flammeovirga sp. MY04]|uniref:Rpn family recombination-promoting nuclease/putative transposase n=1 Tax=Flammeovirga sp. MY04 TaxID=1191459 RepID=UPI00080625C6|nr:Rpn family recombination-promoting nuclease/putative transposase [Flammeovirga sp. MY04]ANQ47965.1 PD-(D/E)XK nuclease family transposase [Flammeovirga sp. MY04]